MHYFCEFVNLIATVTTNNQSVFYMEDHYQFIHLYIAVGDLTVVNI